VPKYTHGIDRLPHAYMYDTETGEILTEIKAPYRWLLRHMDEVTRFVISETRNGGAIVDAFTNRGTALRQHWGSCRLANERYNLYNKKYGQPVSFFSYNPLSASNSY